MTTGGDINTLKDGIYYYNGWGNMAGDKPFTNAWGIWIKRSAFNGVDVTNRGDVVFNLNTGAVYVRSNGGAWVIK